MSNIENDPYKEVKAIRDRNSVMCSVTFFDAGFFDEKVVKIVNLYTYDDMMVLQSIEEELLINQINNKLSDDEAKVFYNSLPDDLKNYFIKSKMIS